MELSYQRKVHSSLTASGRNITVRGTYHCTASNELGSVHKAVDVNIQNIDANVMILHVTSSSVTFSWKKVRSSHPYEVAWRPANIDSAFHRVSIKPYMRSYTASDLHISRLYEFCLAVIINDTPDILNCTIVRTKSKEFVYFGIWNTRNYMIGGGIISLLLLCIVISSGIYSAQKYNQRKHQHAGGKFYKLDLKIINFLKL